MTSAMLPGLFADFVQSLMNHQYETTAGLLHAVCHRPECGTDNLAGELQRCASVWQSLHGKVGGAVAREWAAIFVLCSNINYLGCFVEGHSDSPLWEQILSTACDRANMASSTLVDLLNTTSYENFPFPVIQVFFAFLRRTFQRAAAVGKAGGVECNLAAQGLVLFRKVKSLTTQNFEDGNTKRLLEREKALVSLIADLLNTSRGDTVLSADIKDTLDQFHRQYPAEQALRVKLYSRLGGLYVRMNAFQSAREELAKAFDLCPEDENKQVIYAQLLAAGVALGQLPSPTLMQEHPVPTEYDDLFAAVEFGNIELFNYALHQNASYFLAHQVLNAIHAARSKVYLNMVVKFFQDVKTNNCSHILDLRQLADQYTEVDPAAAIFATSSSDGGAKTLSSEEQETEKLLAFSLDLVMPLVSRREINGRIEDRRYLVVSKKKPFPAYPSVTSPEE